MFKGWNREAHAKFWTCAAAMVSFGIFCLCWGLSAPSCSVAYSSTYTVRYPDAWTDPYSKEKVYLCDDDEYTVYPPFDSAHWPDQSYKMCMKIHDMETQTGTMEK